MIRSTKLELLSMIKSGKIVFGIRLYLARLLAPKNYVVTAKAMWLSEAKTVTQSFDYVRTGALELNAYEINNNRIEGDVAEIGVYRGRFARHINRVFPNRKLYLFDTFDGFDERDVKRDNEKEYSDGFADFSQTSIDLVLDSMPYRDNCVVKKGYFPETTRGMEKTKFAFVSIDADLYEPIINGLEFFYPRLSEGGVIFVHDYNNREYKGAEEAVKEFCIKSNISYFLLPDSCGTAVIIRN